jgi:hypothetical protein
MNELQRISRGVARNILFSIGLVIGGIFEFLNHRTLMLSFMRELYGESGAFAQVGAVLGAMFLITCIVATGLRHKKAVSWMMAAITTAVSFAVYARIWEDTTNTTVHMAIVILSGILPLMVAYFTHEIGKDIPMEVEDPVEQMRQKAEQARALQKVRDNYRDVLHAIEPPAAIPPTPPPPPPAKEPERSHLSVWRNGSVYEPGKL